MKKGVKILTIISIILIGFVILIGGEMGTGPSMYIDGADFSFLGDSLGDIVYAFIVYFAILILLGIWGIYGIIRLVLWIRKNHKKGLKVLATISIMLIGLMVCSYFVVIYELSSNLDWLFLEFLFISRYLVIPILLGIWGSYGIFSLREKIKNKKEHIMNDVRDVSNKEN